MRRLARHLFTLCSVVSLLLCIAVCVVWARSRGTYDWIRYTAEDVVIVREVTALLSLGLTAEQTYPFIECLRAGNDRADVCPASLSAYRLRIAEVDRRIAELTDLRGKLTGLLADAENWRRRSHAPADS